MEDKIKSIKTWLGTGSINIFGLPMSGKDTQGINLATLLGGKFLSSGMIIRAREAETHHGYSNKGNLIPTDVFYEWVLPFFAREDLAKFPLVLSSIGRWSGEEDEVMRATAAADHEIKAVILLNISEADVEARFATAQITHDRGDRKDDKSLDIFRNRLTEFRTKTLPVIKHYRDLGLLMPVNGDQPRDAVLNDIINGLYEKSQQATLR